MTGLSLEHQGRELLHSIDMLNRCLEVRVGTAAARRRWGKDIRKAEAELAALYVAGLDRDFRNRR